MQVRAHALMVNSYFDNRIYLERKLKEAQEKRSKPMNWFKKLCDLYYRIRTILQTKYKVGDIVVLRLDLVQKYLPKFHERLNKNLDIKFVVLAVKEVPRDMIHKEFSSQFLSLKEQHTGIELSNWYSSYFFKKV